MEKYITLESLSRFLSNLSNKFDPKGSSNATEKIIKTYTDNAVSNLESFIETDMDDRFDTFNIITDEEIDEICVIEEVTS